MRKKCVCGVTLSDTIVPNDVIYWTYPLSDYEKLIKRYDGICESLDQTAIWYCKTCYRFYHWGKDWNHYTYKRIETFQSDKIIDWNDKNSVYISYNDFEDDKNIDTYKTCNKIMFPRKVYVTSKNVVVKEGEKVVYYEVESIQAMSRPK